MNDLAEQVRRIPSVDRVLGLPDVAVLVARHGRAFTTQQLRALLGEIRARMTATGAQAQPAPDDHAIVALLADRLERAARPNVRRVFNLTGTVLHTNLGRAVMADVAIDAAVQAMRHAGNLEYDLARGERGERDRAVDALLCELTGAQAATVVNNNAAAVLLALNTFGAGKEVIVSRGELIEIGGSFRIPDIMKRAGCKLVEVGTTNRTRARDFADAISPRTSMLLKVHASNYAIVGFTESVEVRDLAPIAREHGRILLEDLGAGALVDLAQWGLPHEHTPRESIEAGANLVTFSGDKLLGGPQCGLIVGDKALIERINRNPLKRALRIDKVTLAALEATLRLYRDPERLAERLPTLRWLTRNEREIAAQAARVCEPFQRALSAKSGADLDVSVQAVRSQIGSGALPTDLLPSAAIAIQLPASLRKGRGRLLERIERALRALPIPVIGRIDNDALLLDLRCLDDEAAFLAQLESFALD